jgi:transcriptional regulator of arginine metabolism
MRKKNERHEAIRKLVREGSIRTQTQLVEELKRLGFNVTQATVSRDVAQLGLEKITSEDGKSVYILAEDRHLRRMCEDLVLWARESGNLVVVKTTPGGASSVAQAVDAARWDEVVGTIAGDDTFLIVTVGENEAKEVARRIRQLAS